MFFSIKRTTQAREDLVDIAEAYNLWNILKSFATTIESALIWENYIHDIDFRILINKFIDLLKNDVKKLEIMLEKYSIKGPDSYPSFVRTSAPSEVMRDQYIASQYLLCQQEFLEMCLRVLTAVSTNDKVRRFISVFTKKSIDNLDMAIKYVKLKGWIESPPLYPHIPNETKDEIDCGEAYLLWDHLSYRYDSMRSTDYIYAMAKDIEFKLIIKQGLNEMLRKQIKTLEKEMELFGIPSPIHPTNVMPPVTHEKKEVDDDFLFRSIFNGIQGAIVIHARAIKQCVTNDRIRNLFKELLLQEMDSVDDLVKYGKLKGWLDPVPKYSEKK